MGKKIAMTGIQPSGDVHLGNYFGTMKQLLELQEDFDLRVMVANYHAMTSLKDSNQLRENTINLVKDYMAIGLDPERTTIYKQSDLPQVTELTWIFNCLTPLSHLDLAHSFKDKKAKGADVNVGLYDYPVLMTTDIVLHDAEIVPVGKDQKQHVEMGREIVKRFNNQYGEVFIAPQERLVKETEVVPGIDGQKMSKSYGNTIPLFSTLDEIKKAVAKIPTDSAAVEDKKNPDKSYIYQIHKLFLDEEQDREVRAKYENGGLSYKEAKDDLVAAIEDFLAPVREKRAKITDSDVEKVLADSKAKLEPVFEAKMEEVRGKVGLK